jgi:hypothetical protein
MTEGLSEIIENVSENVVSVARHFCGDFSGRERERSILLGYSGAKESCRF